MSYLDIDRGHDQQSASEHRRLHELAIKAKRERIRCEPVSRDRPSVLSDLAVASAGKFNYSAATSRLKKQP